MSDASKIEWTDTTDNIHVVVDETGERNGWWCRKVLPGGECQNCYAETLNQSDYFHGNHLPYSGEAPVIKLREDIIDRWKRKTKGKKRFVESMSDCFGEWLPRTWIFRMLDGMLAAPRQTFQMLTKRPAIARREITAWLAERGLAALPPHMWIVVSAGQQSTVDAFVPILLDIPAAVMGISCEPMLGPVDLSEWLECLSICKACGDEFVGHVPETCPACGRDSLITTWGYAQAERLRSGDRYLTTEGERDQREGSPIKWVICGGESGKGARPMHPDWARSLRNQCVAAGVPFFFKQWGEWTDYRHAGAAGWQLSSTDADGKRYGRLVRDGAMNGSGREYETRYPFPAADGYDRIGPCMVRVGKHAAVRLLDGREWNEFPEVSNA